MYRVRAWSPSPKSTIVIIRLAPDRGDAGNIKIDNELQKANGEKPVLQGINFTVLDNLGAVAPVSIILRTSDSAL